MASTDNIVSARQKIKIGDVETNRSNSESVNSKVGGSMNYLLDSLFFQEGFAFNGYFNANDFDDGVSGIRRISNDSDISEYYMSIRDTGSSGNNIFNVAVYDSAGSFVSNLFGAGANRLLVSGSAGTSVVVGRDVENATTFSTNAGAHTVQFGTLSLTTLLAGYILVPFVEDNGVSARNLYFNLKLKEQ